MMSLLTGGFLPLLGARPQDSATWKKMGSYAPAVASTGSSSDLSQARPPSRSTSAWAVGTPQSVEAERSYLPDQLLPVCWPQLGRPGSWRALSWLGRRLSGASGRRASLSVSGPAGAGLPRCPPGWARAAAPWRLQASVKATGGQLLFHLGEDSGPPWSCGPLASARICMALRCSAVTLTSWE